MGIGQSAMLGLHADNRPALAAPVTPTPEKHFHAHLKSASQEALSRLHSKKLQSNKYIMIITILCMQAANSCATNLEKRLSFDIREDREESQIISRAGARAVDDFYIEDMFYKIYENNTDPHNTINKNTNQNLIEQLRDTNMDAFSLQRKKKNEPETPTEIRNDTPSDRTVLKQSFAANATSGVMTAISGLLPNMTNLQTAAQNKAREMSKRLIAELLPENFNTYCYIAIALTAVFIVCSITWSSFCYCKLLKEVKILKELTELNDLPCDDELCTKRECC